MAFIAVMAIGLAHAFAGKEPVQQAKPETEKPVEMASLTLTDIATPFTDSEKIAHKKQRSAGAAKAKHVSFPEDVGTYVRRFQKTAVLEMSRYGVPASISMAQGILESQSGQSQMAREINNHFGMKCHLRDCKKGHCANYADDSNKDFFRKFNNAWESWRAHSLLLTTSSRYKDLVGKSYKDWAYGLKKGGYATQRHYAENLIRLIEQYDLQRLDDGHYF